jgi:hypothetical protein
MHGPISVKSANNISKWQMGFNSAFKGLMFDADSRGAVCGADVGVVTATTRLGLLANEMAI